MTGQQSNIRAATIADIQYIVPLLEEHYSCDLMYGMELHLSTKIRDSFNNLIILNSDNTMVLFVERMGNFKCQLHIYTASKVRGREVKIFFNSALDKIIEEVGYTTFFTFVPEENVAADFAARVVGFKKIIEIEDAGGDNKKETMYLLKRKDK